MRTAISAVLALAAMPAHAASALHPVQVGGETLRYRDGVPTLSLDLPGGTVDVTPLPADHGALSFGVALHNRASPAHFGLGNITATVDGRPVPLLSKERLAAKARSRALWTSLAVAALTGVAAGVASTATTQRRYRGTVVSGGRRVSGAGRVQDNSAGLILAAGATAGGAQAIGRVRADLDDMLDGLDGEIVQTSTVDRDQRYGGRIVLEKVALPARYEVRIDVAWNGQRYPFTFRQVARGDASPPAFAIPVTTAARAPVSAPAAVAPSLSPYEAGRLAGRQAAQSVALQR